MGIALDAIPNNVKLAAACPARSLSVNKLDRWNMPCGTGQRVGAALSPIARLSRH